MTEAQGVGPISKLEAARRQLDQAILLFLSAGDSVSIHSLTLNAFEICVTLARRTGATDWLELVREDASSELGVGTKKEFFEIFHRARNFFKHADRDAEETLPSFGDGDNDFAVALTVFQYGEVAERTAPMWAFLVWFCATHPAFPVPDKLEPVVARYMNAASLDRAGQLKIGRAILQEFVSLSEMDAKSMADTAADFHKWAKDAGNKLRAYMLSYASGATAVFFLALTGKEVQALAFGDKTLLCMALLLYVTTTVLCLVELQVDARRFFYLAKQYELSAENRDWSRNQPYKDLRLRLIYGSYWTAGLATLFMLVFLIKRIT